MGIFLILCCVSKLSIPWYFPILFMRNSNDGNIVDVGVGAEEILKLGRGNLG